MSAYAPPPSKVIPPFTKIDLGKRQSYDTEKKKKKANSHRTQLIAAAKQTKLFNCFIPNTMIFSQCLAIWRNMTEKCGTKSIEFSNSYKPLYLAYLSHLPWISCNCKLSVPIQETRGREITFAKIR